MPRTKPQLPTWQPTRATAGCRGYWPLTEGGGRTLRDYAGRRYDGSFVGSPTWRRGAYGPELGGFTASDYVDGDPSAAAIFAAGPPFWLAVMVSGMSPTTTISVPISLYNSANNQEIIIYVNNGVDGQVASFLRNDGGTNLNIIVNDTPLNDGKPHVLMHLSAGVADHRLYFDGRLIGSDAGSFSGPLQLASFTIGARNRGTADIPFVDGSIVWCGAGNGANPDPYTLTDGLFSLAGDLISGQFSAIRTDPRSRIAAALTAPPPAASTAPASILMGFC